MAKSKRKVRAKAKPKAKAKKAMKLKIAKISKIKIKLHKLPKEELKKYKLLLIRLRGQVGGDLSHIAQNTLNKSARDASGDLSGYSYHMADQASDDYERDFSLERATAEQKILYFIDEAMKRIDDGTYGNCLSCGKQIAKRRLVALPYSELCIECQKKKEN
ncbi:MAG: TraR/DksA C4-type zinc finger protein [Candidatus Omnitrophica bacterium]|nr:TraR/DksA C4-type zinc finger protein [Candidatus Omnitrophota bacterium]